LFEKYAIENEIADYEKIEELFKKDVSVLGEIMKVDVIHISLN